MSLLLSWEEKMNPAIRSHLHVVMVAVLAWVLTAICLQPTCAYAEESSMVRVGWFESPFNITDGAGRRSGYSYDYEQRISAYTGWSYEYVEGSWSELLEMLIDGRIDLLSDVSFTEERSKLVSYSSLPMGAEEYYLFADPRNQDISADDYSTFNGKRIGVNKGSIQIDLFRSWAKSNGVNAKLVELTGGEDENLSALKHGYIDLYLSLGGFFDETAVPIALIGSSEFFFAVSPMRQELKADLNSAMNRIASEDPYYNQKLSAKYLSSVSSNYYLTPMEENWIADHASIRVGYQDNYMALCDEDPDTGQLTGALKDYLKFASTCMKNASIQFEPIAYQTSEDAMKALARGEIDCMFPANLTPYDGETLGIYVSPPLMTTEMAAVIRDRDQEDFADKERVTVAVNAGNPNYDVFLKDHFPEWRAIYFPDTPACLRAISEGRADCLLISTYRYNDIAPLCRELGLSTWATGVEMDYCFAVRRKDQTLYSILAKVTESVPQSIVNAALTHYYTEDARPGLADLVRENLLSIAMGVAALVVLGLSLLLLRRVRMRERKAADHKLPPTKEDFAFLDDLPVSYSVYRVTHIEHSELYDAEIIYVNHAFERNGKIPASNALGHHVRELYPYIEEGWFQLVKRAACDGETVEYDYTDPLRGVSYHLTAWQVKLPGYCAVTYQGR